MDRFNIPLVAEGLTTYAIERQNGFERDQRPGEPPWAEQRRFWTDAILQGMVRLEGLTPDPTLMKRFDQELEEARRRYFIIPATLDRQRDTIYALNRFAIALENTRQDRRRQIQVVQKMMDDMACHSRWGKADNGLDRAQDNAEQALIRMTARQPICFTRILLGGDAGPYWESSFVSGPVTEADEVKQTAVYERARRLHPEIMEWPALCTVWVGGGLSSALGTRDADEFDLEIMNQMGDQFLKEQGVCCVGGPYQTSILIEEAQAMENCSVLQGVRPLKPADFEIYECFGEDEGQIAFSLDVMADERTVFGRELTCERMDSYAVTYCTYDITTGRVCELLDIEQRFPHDENWFCCRLTDEVRDSLRQKMNAFYLGMYGEDLPIQEQPPSQLNQTM